MAIDHLYKQLNAAKKRVDDDHAMKMGMLGYEVNKPEQEDMGISVAGDTHINITSPVAAGASGMFKKALPYIATLLAGGALSAGGLLVGKYLFGASPRGPADSEYEIRFFDKDGNPIEVPRYQQAK